MKKLLVHLNPLNWAKGFMFTKFAQKAVTGVVTTLVGLAITPKVVEILTQYGVSVDEQKLKAGAVAALVGLLMGLVNSAKHGAKAD